MKRIREALRLIIEQGVSRTRAARALGMGKTTILEMLARFKQSGLSLSEALALSDSGLESRLYPCAIVPPPPIARREPDMEHVASELKRPGVTMKLLWKEYRQEHPEGIGYTQFRRRVHRVVPPVDLVMHQDHKPGENAMVDYSGNGLSVVDASSGEVHGQELFVMVWACSGLCYCEAQESQKLPDWTMGHVRGFEYSGCVPKTMTPDCLRSAVTKAHRYDPVLNRTYVEMCTYHGTVAVPARAGHPRDKGKVEGMVRIVQQQIVAVLRNQTFHTLLDLNGAIRKEVDRINDTPMPGYGARSRRQLFEELDRPAALALPEKAWEYQLWLVRRVGPDYCVEVDHHWYSVPYQLAGTSVEVCVTGTAVTVYQDQQRVAVHGRVPRPGYSIQESHMPPAHLHCLPENLDRLLYRAQRIGPWVCKLVQARIDAVIQPVAAWRACMGLVRQAENCPDPAQAERAARYALKQHLISCHRYEQILRSKVAEAEPEQEELGVVKHTNLHGMELWAKAQAN